MSSDTKLYSKVGQLKGEKHQEHLDSNLTEGDGEMELVSRLKRLALKHLRKKWQQDTAKISPNLFRSGSKKSFKERNIFAFFKGLSLIKICDRIPEGFRYHNARVIPHG